MLLGTLAILSAWPLGLRTDHLVFTDGSAHTVYDNLASALTSVTRLALSGSLPETLRPYLCGGLVVPLVKMEEFSRLWLDTALAARQGTKDGQALISLQLSVGAGRSVDCSHVGCCTPARAGDFES